MKRGRERERAISNRSPPLKCNCRSRSIALIDRFRLGFPLVILVFISFTFPCVRHSGDREKTHLVRRFKEGAGEIIPHSENVCAVNKIHLGNRTLFSGALMAFFPNCSPSQITTLSLSPFPPQSPSGRSLFALDLGGLNNRSRLGIVRNTNSNGGRKSKHFLSPVSRARKDTFFFCVGKLLT